MADASGSIEPPEAPDWFKGLKWAWHHLVQNVQTVKKAPSFFAAILVAGLAGGYLVGMARYSDLVSAQNERISLLGDQVAAYKDKKKDVSPTESDKRIAALEAQLHNFVESLSDKTQQRTLKLEEKSKLTASLREWGSEFPPLNIYSVSDVESSRYALDFRGFFKSSGITVYGPFLASADTTQIGVMVGVQDPDNPGDLPKKFVNTLHNAGFKTTYTRWDNANTPELFDLFIGPKD